MIDSVDSDSFFVKLRRRWLYFFARFYSDKRFLEKLFPLRMGGAKLNLDNPQTFSEKLQWLKLNDHNPLYTIMVDKYEAKKYVASIIGDEYIIPTLAVYDNVKDIRFEDLPNQFVLKCTHDSGGVFICKDKAVVNEKEAKRMLARHLKRNYYWKNREWPYKNVRPRIIAEKYLTDDGNGLKDYKIFNFDGQPKMVELDYNRFTGHLRKLYTPDWKLINATIKYPAGEETFQEPKVLKEMLLLSSKLSQGIPHVRTDFYVVNNHVYFGELTFYHESGMAPMNPANFDNKIGEWIVLPRLERCY